MDPLKNYFNTSLNEMHDTYTSMAETIDDVRDFYVNMAFQHAGNSDFLEAVAYYMELAASNNHMTKRQLILNNVEVMKDRWNDASESQKKSYIAVIKNVSEQFRKAEDVIKHQKMRIEKGAPPLPKFRKLRKRTVTLVPGV